VIPKHVKEALKATWGDKASTLQCYAEVKIIDPLSSWACYIFAMSEDEKEVQCLVYTHGIGAQILTLDFCDLFLMYNAHGENPVIDTEYRRTLVTELLKRFK
jgi:hypothetical protein